MFVLRKLVHCTTESLAYYNEKILYLDLLPEKSFVNCHFYGTQTDPESSLVKVRGVTCHDGGNIRQQ